MYSYSVDSCARRESVPLFLTGVVELTQHKSLPHSNHLPRNASNKKRDGGTVFP
jgi:hypothetical protein